MGMFGTSAIPPLYNSKKPLYPAEWDCREHPGRRYAKWIPFFLAALLDRHVMARVVAEVDLAGAGNLLLGVEEHFFPLRNPPGSAWNREQHREHRHRETHRLVDEAGVEVHIGIELALYEVFVFEGDALTFESDFKERILAHEVENFIGDALDDARAGIVMLVDAVAEAHQLHFAGLHALDELRYFLYRANLHEHVQDFFIRAAVERSVERGNGRRQRGIGIHVGTAHAAHRVCRAVLFVVGMQNEKNIQRALQRGVGTVLRLGRPKQHVQEITRIAQVVVWIYKRHAQGMPVRKRRDGRHLANQPVWLLLAGLGAEDILRIMVERGKSGNRRYRHAHGMGVVMEAIEEFLDALVDVGVVRDVVGPILQLRGCRQLAGEQQVGGF